MPVEASAPLTGMSIPILTIEPPPAAAWPDVEPDDVDDDCAVLDDDEAHPAATDTISAAAESRATTPDRTMKTSTVGSERRRVARTNRR
ncbi:MAG: hypothetical protein NVSMB19_01820 [Vulcanimicrobiaceae bacterium]